MKMKALKPTAATILTIAAVLLCLNPFGKSSKGVAQSDPQPRALPEGPLGEAIKLGEQLVEKTTTHPLTKALVGNTLNCTSCHLKNGTDPHAGTFVGVAAAYPAWSAREGRVITLEDRVLNCFMRSCNGTRPAMGSKASVAIVAYITWLSEGEPLRMNPKKPSGARAVQPLTVKADAANRVRGERLYAAKCGSCHANDGGGRVENPPVWGPKSYNQGAGLADTDKLAAWLKVAMPLDEPTLSEQEAVDVAAFVTSKERPAFHVKDHLPLDGKIGEYNAETE